MNHFALPLAAAGDLVLLAVAILFFLVPLVGQLLAKGRQGAENEPPVRGKTRPPGQDEQLNDEIGDFLRKATNRGQRRQPAAPGRPLQDAQPPVVKEAIGDEIVEHVQQHLDTRGFSQRAAQLGEEVSQSDGQLKERLHERFDHRLGQLEGAPGKSALAPDIEEPEFADQGAAALRAATAGLPAMLGSTVGLSRAIILTEILRRPEHRW